MNHLDEEDRRALNSRLEIVAWGLFLVTIGFLLLLPGETVPRGAWAVGVGIILLGLNFARYLSGIVVRHFSVALGVMALVGGLADYLGGSVPLIPLIIVLIGAELIFSALYGRYGQRQSRVR